MKIYQPTVNPSTLSGTGLVDDTPKHKVGSSQPGLGGMQGSMVSVGSGDTSKITTDSHQSQGFLYSIFSMFYSSPKPEVDETDTVIEEEHLPENTGSVRKDNVPVEDEDNEEFFSVDEPDDSEQFFSFDEEVDEENTIFYDCSSGDDFLQEVAPKKGSDEVPIDDQPLESLIDKSDLEELSTEDEPPREEVQEQVQQQQSRLGSLFSGAMALGGWVASKALDVGVGVAVGVVQTVQTAYNYVTSENSETSGTKSSEKLTLQQQNLIAMQKLTTGIEDKFDKLNMQLRQMGAEELQQPESQRLDKPKLTMWDTLTRWNHQARGAFSATVSTLGWGAVGAGVATGGSLVPHLGVQTTAVLGGAYLGLSALRDFPSLAHNQGAISLVEASLKDIDKDLAELERLKTQEKSRQEGMTRTMVISLERQEHVGMLQAELEEVSRAMETAPTSSEQVIPSKHEVTVSDGAQRRETLGAMAKAKGAFQSFFSAIGSGLASIGRFIADLPNVPGRFLERRAAGKAELAYTQGEGKSVLSTLSVPKENSIVGRGVEVRAMQRAREEGGTTQPLLEVRRQIVTGENLSRAILSSKEGTFGAVVVQDESGKLPVTANLTTARSLAWYLDTLAQESEHVDPNAPKVQRGEDGALMVSDPDGKLYGFLMHVPTAYTSSMTSEGQSPTPGGLRLDDYHNGFPQGGRGMQFERTLDKDGNFVVRITFPKEQGKPAVFTPLGNERQALMRMYEAMHTSGQVLSGNTDYSDWTRERLEARRDFLIDELERQTKLMSGDQDQITQLEDWQNPAFLTGRA